jgi:transposase
MAKRNRVEAGMTVGLDLGDRFSRFCVLDAEGEILEEGRVASTRKGLLQRFGNLPSCRVALEVGTHSPWVQRLLVGIGHEVLVANARKLRLIYHNESKSDQLDAENLARLARVDPKLLHPIRHRDRESQEAMAVLRSRHALVEARAKLVNHVRGAVKSFGSRIKSCSTESFHKQAAGQLPEELLPAVAAVLEVIADLTRKIRGYDQQIEQLSEQHYPQTSLLREVRGVGPVTALWFVLTIGDPHRFSRSRRVGAYLGLRPRRGQSGDDDPELQITKTGGPGVTTAAGDLGPLHPGAVWTGHRSAPLGTGNGRPRAEEREETSRGGRGPQAGGAAALPMAQRGGVRAAAKQ